MTRRAFLLGAGMCAIPGLPLTAADEPLLTAGFVTDTHVLPNDASLERVRRAYRFFASRKVGLIANLGDIANQYSAEAYRLYAAARAAAYPDAATRPQEAFVWANHDRINFTPGVYASSYEDSFAAAKPILGIGNGLYDRFEKGGFTFLVFPQNADIRRCETEIAKAVSDNPGRPVFVLTHVPPKGTTEGSESSGSAPLARVLRRFPQVVCFSGHTHGSLRDERLIWQDGFTAVNLGCLASWRGNFLGKAADEKACWDCACLEFHSDRLVIRRFSLRDGAEIRADAPWTVVWGKGLPRLAARKGGRFPPQFPDGARLSVAPDATPMHLVRVSFPASDRPRETAGYRLKIARRTATGWETLAVREICGDFYRESDEPAARTFADELPAAFFEPGDRYRLTVAPYGFFANVGRELTGEFAAPSRAGSRMLCDVTDGLPTLSGGERWRCPESVQRVPAKTRLRLVVDAESERSAQEPMNFRMECFPKKEALCGWVVCEPGKVFRRYVVDFHRGTGRQEVFLSPTFSPKSSRLKLLRVRIEEIGGPAGT